MSSNVDSVGSVDSSRALALAAFGLCYLYVALSAKSVVAGLPVLVGLGIHWVMDNKLANAYPRTILGTFAGLNFIYWLAATSHILYPAFAVSAWFCAVVVCFSRYPVCLDAIQPLRNVLMAQITRLETRVRDLQWPILDFDGRGILALTGSTLDLSQMTLTISGIDFSFEVDAETKIIARLECLQIRLARDIAIKEIYVNIKGDGTAASDAKSFASVSRSATDASTPSRASTESARLDGPRRLPPAPPSLGGSVTASPASIRSMPLDGGQSPAPPRLPPRLPPRTTMSQSTSETSLSNTLSGSAHDTDVERAEMERAIEESLRTSTRTSTETVSHDNPAQTSFVHEERDASLENPDTAFFYPESEDADDAALRAAFDESAIHHATTDDSPEQNDIDMKAAIAASLEDQTQHHKASTTRVARVKLSDILAKIPWWLKVTPGPLVMRLLLSPVAWLHPITVSAIAASGTGKRITNLLETGGLKKAHPNQEIFKLIRKVFLWLEAGDISIVLNDIRIRPHVPLSADHAVRIEVSASEPTAYRNTTGTDEVLAKIHAIGATFHLPTYLLPSHGDMIPATPRGIVTYTMSLSLPGVFNRELLTIGAAFVKATTMMDLRQTAQNRPAPVLPSLRSGQQFSFKSLGLAVKQAAGDLAKQKGVQWGVRDAELAKWTAKLARLVGVIRVDVGSHGEIPIDLYKLRRAAIHKQ